MQLPATIRAAVNALAVSAVRRLDAAMPGVLPARQIRADAWVNYVTGLGTAQYDKVENYLPAYLVPLTYQTLAVLYDDDWVCARGVDLIVHDAMRQGLTLTGPGADRVQAEIDRLGAWETLSRAWRWGRLFGRGGLYLGVSGSGLQSQPLDPAAIRQSRNPARPTLAFALDLEPRQAFPTGAASTDPWSPGYGEPQTWQITSPMQPATVHTSRVVWLGGATTPAVDRQSLSYADFSVLQRTVKAVQRWEHSVASTAAMIADSSQLVLTIPGLKQIASGAGNYQQLQTELAAMNLARSVHRLIPIDGGDGQQAAETLSMVERQMASLPELLSVLRLYVSAAFDVPHSRFWGDAASGSNATGEGDRIDWDRTVLYAREYRLKPSVASLVRIVAPAVGVDPAGLTIAFPALDNETPRQRADRELAEANTDRIYLEAGVLDRTEVRAELVADGEAPPLTPGMDPQPVAMLMAREQQGRAAAPRTDAMPDGGQRCDVAVDRQPPRGSEGDMVAQTIVFPDGWTRDEVVIWLQDHDYYAGSLDRVGDRKYRARQYDPDHFESGSFRTLAVGKQGVKLVLGRVTR